MKWLYLLASPRYFYMIARRLLPWLSVLTVLLLFCGIGWALLFVPADYQQAHTVRILYIHVPAALLAESCFIFMAAIGSIGFIWHIKMADIIAKCIAPIGASFTVLTLLSGAIWGKPTWGTLWFWDARLASTLILLFLYMAIIGLHQAITAKHIAARITAIFSVIACVHIPVIKYSVEWWYTLHQPASFSLTAKPAMPLVMWLPLVIMLIGFYSFFLVALLLRVRHEILVRDKNCDWVKQVVKHHAT